MTASVQDRLRPLAIQEVQTICDHIHTGGIFYARYESETIAALDYRCEQRDLHVDVIFVKPDFRNRGVASVLVACLLRRYPDKHLSGVCDRLSGRIRDDKNNSGGRR